MPNYDRRPISPQDAWLLDNAGKIVGVELAQARQQKTYLPGSDTDGAIAADVTGDLTGNVTGNITGSSSAGTNTANAGSAADGVTAVEYGDGRHHITVLTIDTALPAIAGGASLGVGVLLYTLPAGAQVIRAAHMNVAITQTEGNITADTPDVGLGTVIASGAVAVLSGTATFEDILTGQTAADCDGTATVKSATPTASPFALVRESGDAKTIHLNVADGWAASGDAAAELSGTVVIVWDTLA